uniref:HAUS augmin-like complex, subunit 5 n=1 Tax=Paramormyrops kingsleyae TaxID=1676925 RepID=A0A3B3T7Z8_9TELE|nr:HAUS augmin-like complex subunit 5 [Paramormyrops kingsleyae]XP_023674223.1 HAUS augmin-like complex subunit 5 [Paramormyrops kingsleyae]XP_023674224.1 HAUS augmin-like complex subunit 5 [Paramormyrops kingsleyae]XP_023674225.1 HAUS augmin-like complex subunit 5 [Paramormyrops kingsleyae]
MADRSLPREIKRWATEEFNLPSKYLLPDNLKTLCLGRGSSIWEYVIQHVYNQRNVRIMRGNLQWYKSLQDNEVQRVEGLSEVAKKERLKKDIEELRAELNQLDAQISIDEAQLEAEERCIGRSWDSDRDSRQRDILLQAARQRCSDERRSVDQDCRRLNGHCQTLSRLSRKAEVELVFGGDDSSSDSLSSLGPEPQVLRAVRKLVEERVSFFCSLLESELKRVPSSAVHMSREQRGVVFQHWLSAVEDLLQSHPPSHLLSALQHLASHQQVALQEKQATLDVGQEVAALGYHYKSSSLQGISGQDEELPSVRSLLQSGWQDVEQIFVQQALTQVRFRQLKTQLDARKKEAALDLLGGEGQTEALAEAAFEVELQCVMKAALRDSVLSQCEQLEEQVRRRQDAVHGLRSRWQSIMDFRQLVDNKQEQIRGLIKGNSAAKTAVSRVHAEVGHFAQRKVAPLCQSVLDAAGNLRNTVSQGVRQMAGVSLAALDARTLDGVQRVPAEWLSIHRLHSGTFHSLCQNLAFPMYKAPEQLCAQAVSQQLRLRFLHRLLQLYSASQTDLQNQRAQQRAPDLTALLLQVRELDEELLQSVLPQVQQLSQRTSQALLFAAEVKTAIGHWWEQPAQFALPEMTTGGLTLQQWLQRWRLAAKALE